MNAPEPGSPGDVVAMTPELVRALDGLRDLQLAGPAVPLWLPWAGAAALAAAILAVSVWRRRPRQAARRRLRRLHEAFRAKPAGVGAASAAVDGIHRILRAEATRPGRFDRVPPGLAGEDWLRWLDARTAPADRGAFVTGPGRWLATQPYAPGTASIDASEIEALFALAGRWLKQGALPGGDSAARPTRLAGVRS